MLQLNTVQFLKNLKKNNRKEWFDTNRARYDAAKKDVENLSAEIIKRLSRADETIAHLQPVIALIAGILILVMPRLLNFIVAIYLIIVGLLGLGIFR